MSGQRFSPWFTSHLEDGYPEDEGSRLEESGRLILFCDDAKGKVSATVGTSNWLRSNWYPRCVPYRAAARNAIYVSVTFATRIILNRLAYSAFTHPYAATIPNDSILDEYKFED